MKGRELEELELALTWDRTLWSWQCEGTAEDGPLSGRRGEVLSILQEAYPASLLAGEIARAAEMQRANVLPLLNDLVREGQVKKEAKQGKDQPYRATRGSEERAPEGEGEGAV